MGTDPAKGNQVLDEASGSDAVQCNNLCMMGLAPPSPGKAAVLFTVYNVFKHALASGGERVRTPKRLADYMKAALRKHGRQNWFDIAR